MGWNKNTIDNSNLRIVEKVLKLIREQYKKKLIATVEGRGLNDDLMDGEYKLYAIYVRDKIFYDQMWRTDDCDMDDFIQTVVVDKKDVESGKVEITPEVKEKFEEMEE